MDPQRWVKIESLYHAALARKPAERPDYLAAACAQEPELQREVESLLGAANADLRSPLLTGDRNWLPGFRLGAYEILAPLGAGGMGEVYRARDTKLRREVAIKVLPREFERDFARLARFEREAHVLASLNNRRIAAIYDLEEFQGIRFLVLELVEGPTLADRIARGPIPQDEALAIAAQVIEAMEYAHERNVVHRDLKPANIKVTPEGDVKVLDFGLAKALSDPAPSTDSADSPTLDMGRTEIGMILGTPAYMSPEQASGKPADRRADIWSFGAVLYEMLTGKRAFEGESVSHTLASVLKVEPDFNALPGSTPAAIRNLIRRCLTKDPKQRLQAIGEARIILENPHTEEPAAAVSSPKHVWLWLAVAATLLAVYAGLALIVREHFREKPPGVVRFSFSLPEGVSLVPQIPAMAVSPDGRHVAFEAITSGKRQLWVRDLDSPSLRMLADLSGTLGIPFWAPDSRRFGFFDGTRLKKVDINGGPATTIADTGSENPGSGSWNRDDLIIFSTEGPRRPLFRVPVPGGAPLPVTELDKARGETEHWAPWFLPDGRHFLYLARSASPETSAVYVGDLDSKNRKQVVAFATKAIYVNPGYLLFVRERTLMAQRFDTASLQTTADAFPVVEQVHVFTPPDPDRPTLGYFSASQNGVLMYTSGVALPNAQLSWFDRAGKKLDSVGAPGQLPRFSLSPDGGRLALARDGDSQLASTDIWVRDLARGSESRLTSTGNNGNPVWSADGTRLFFVRSEDRKFTVYAKDANGTGTDESLETDFELPMDASRDGRYLITMNRSPSLGNGRGIWVLPLFGDHKPFPYVAAGFQEDFPRLSPDGRWLAYQSNESNRDEVYVVSFPQKDGKWLISTGGGIRPVWSRDGRELYYYSADDKIMAVPITPGAQFRFGVPKPLFDVRLATARVSFDVSRDGRFLLPVLMPQQDSALMNVVLNWSRTLKAN
jgi:serine/threonine protein kinase/Tol biopolymer transport system component